MSKTESKTSARRISSFGLRRRRDAMHDRLQNLVDPDAHLGAAIDRFLGRDGENFLELPMHRREIGVRQIDLVDHRHDRQALLVREVDVGDRLRLDALRRIDDEERAFAGREAARDFVGKIDVAGRIEEVKPVFLAVFARCNASRPDAP